MCSAHSATAISLWTTHFLLKSHCHKQLYKSSGWQQTTYLYSYSSGDIQEDNSVTLCHVSVPCAFRNLIFDSATFSSIPDSGLHCTTVRRHYRPIRIYPPYLQSCNASILRMQAARSSETSGYNTQKTRRHNSNDLNLYDFGQSCSSCLAAVHTRKVALRIQHE
jgi:hypothetical protein